jgi:hypothetical protein
MHANSVDELACITYYIFDGFDSCKTRIDPSLVDEIVGLHPLSVHNPLSVQPNLLVQPVLLVAKVLRWRSKHLVHLGVRVRPNMKTWCSYDLGHIVYRQHRTKQNSDREIRAGKTPTIPEKGEH